MGNIILSYLQHFAVHKYQLKNGLTILVCPMHAAPKVSTQLWYRVGSKDERSGEKGLAHFLEHMLFKGTDRMTESDVNVITHKLSGYCNAFTSYDTTMYLFDMPSQHWQNVLPVLADCMRNARLDQEHLNSELKAVIQELKMYRDDFTGHLFEELVSTIFADHPYHYPIIGFKQDLWSLDRNVLLRFYQKHYIPNNATLVVVGDVVPDNVHQLVAQEFGGIAGNEHYTKRNHFHSEDIVAKTVTLQRAVENPIAVCTWVIPGLSAGQEYIATFASWLLAQGRGSRLYRQIVDELQLAIDVQVHIHNFFEYGLFSFEFQLKNVQDFDVIKQLVASTIEDLVENGWSAREEERARKKIEVDYVNLFECPQKLGMAIGEMYLTTGDEQHVLQFLKQGLRNDADQIKQFMRQFLRSTVMHIGLLVPISADEQERLDELQDISDAIDSKVLQNKIRATPVESCRFAHAICPVPPSPFKAPRAHRLTLSNGLNVLYMHDDRLPTVEIMLDIKTKYYSDPVDLQGLSLCTSYLVQEGTKNHTAYELALELESCGIGLNVDPGFIALTALNGDLPKALDFLQEIMTSASLPKDALNKIKERMVSDIDAYWDEPSELIDCLVREALYRDHPYSKQILGTRESVPAITHDDIVNWYRTTYTPHGATLVIVGDIQQYDMGVLLEERLSLWRGQVPPTLHCPPLEPVRAHDEKYFIKRDQTVVCFAGRSVPRKHPDFDKLLIFDQIFGGGVLNSMNSRLFMLREQSGLFYTIKGSLVAGSDEQTGMIMIKTMVSNDRLDQALESIRHTIATATDVITDEEFEQAKCILGNALIDSFATNQQTAISLLFLARYGFPDDYFDTRMEVLNAIDKQDMISVVKRYLDNERLICTQVGRVSENS